MKNYRKYLLFMLLPFIFLAACVDDENLDEAPPTTEDARFSFAPSSQTANIIDFTADKEFFLMQWDLGNGSTAEGKTAQGIYPNAGTYTVTLTIFNNNGSASFSTDVVIEQDDPTLVDSPIFNFLTGGAAQANGKTWVIDANRDGHFGVGPNPSQEGDFPQWYAAKALEKEGSGMYTDEYTFLLDNSRFIMETNGLVYLNVEQGSNFPEAFDPGVGDLSAPYTAPDNLTWSLQEPEDEYPVLTISEGGFLGYFAGTRSYQIVNLEENEMFIRFVDGANEELAWYLRLVPKGMEGEAPEPEETEMGDVNFTFDDLIGEGTKQWKLKPAAGAFGVGPRPMSDEFFPNGVDISEDRACLFNDLYIFNSDGVYEYDAQGDIFGETYMGVAEDGCQPESNLNGTPGEAWASGTHAFEFTSGTADTNPKITVTGTGAFIALAKAFNGGEYSEGPPSADASVTYTVAAYDEETQELTLVLDITDSGSVWWTFVLVPND